MTAVQSAAPVVGSRTQSIPETPPSPAAGAALGAPASAPLESPRRIPVHATDATAAAAIAVVAALASAAALHAARITSAARGPLERSRRSMTETGTTSRAERANFSCTVRAMEAGNDAVTSTMSRLVAALAEEAIFAFAGASGGAKDAIEGIIKRRADAHLAFFQAAAQPAPTMTGGFDAWLVELTRAAAPVAPPVWLPMSEVIREKVTLEAGARGLRSLFSSKPSDKDVQRVKRLGTLSVRVLRAVYAADGPVDAEEGRTIAALVASLGLPEADTAPLYAEAPQSMEEMSVYGDVEANVARAVVRGAWLAAVWDALDPREEQVVRTVASKLNVAQEDVDAMRNEAIARVDARRAAGLAAVDAVRFVLADRVPGAGIQLAALVGTLMLPRRYREETLAQVAAGTPVTLSKRHGGLTGDERAAALGVAWGAALHDDPSLGRRALLRARLDRFAADLGDEGGRVRPMVEAAIDEALAIVASGIR